MRLLRYAALVLCVPLAAAEKTMQESTEERIQLVATQQIPVGDKAAAAGKVPQAWWDEMKAVVMPASFDSARKFAVLVDEWVLLGDEMAAGVFRKEKGFVELADRYIRILQRSREHTEAHTRYMEKHLAVHSRHGVSVSTRWQQERAKYIAICDASLRVGKALNTFLQFGEEAFRNRHLAVFAEDIDKEYDLFGDAIVKALEGIAPMHARSDKFVEELR